MFEKKGIELKAEWKRQ